MNLLYPPQCQHCECVLEKSHKILCSLCFEDLSFTTCNNRCKRCFELNEGVTEHAYCERCFKNPSPFFRTLFVLEFLGPALSLEAKALQMNTSFLNKGLSALLVLHLLKQNMPKPDLIVPMPSSFWKRFFKGPNASYSIAKGIAEIFKLPLVNALSASHSGFSIKRRSWIEDKIVLLVGSRRDLEFFSAGEALIEGAPQMILGAGLFTE